MKHGGEELIMDDIIEFIVEFILELLSIPYIKKRVIRILIESL